MLRFRIALRSILFYNKAIFNGCRISSSSSSYMLVHCWISASRNDFHPCLFCPMFIQFLWMRFKSSNHSVGGLSLLREASFRGLHYNRYFFWPCVVICSCQTTRPISFKICCPCDGICHYSSPSYFHSLDSVS